MKKIRTTTVLSLLLISIFLLGSCERRRDTPITNVEREPIIEPDYSGVTIPSNIAPLNFIIKEEGKGLMLWVRSANGTETEIKLRNGIALFPTRVWKKLLSENIGSKIEITIFTRDKENKVKSYAPFSIYVANESADPYLCYRLLYPGYESWSEMQIIERSIEDFTEKVVFENQLLEDNCVNCHTFLKNNPENISDSCPWLLEWNLFCQR